MMIVVAIMFTGNDADDSGEWEEEEEMMIITIMMKIDCANSKNNDQS